MRNRVPVLSLLMLAAASSAAAQTAPQYPPPGTYPPPQPYAQPQQQQPPPQQQQPYPGDPYAQPTAAQGYGPPPEGYAGYSPLAGEVPPDMISSVAYKIHFSLGMNLVRYRATSISAENNGGEADRSSVNWGFSDAAPLQLEVGYGLTDQIVVGGVLQLGGDSETFEVMNGGKQETSKFDFVLMPKIDYQFSPTSMFNPFAGAMLGIAISSQDTTVAGVTQGESSTMFVMLARVGLRCFLTPGLSVDPALVVGFGVGGGSQELSGGPQPGAELGFGNTAFQVGLTVAISGWLE